MSCPAHGPALLTVLPWSRVGVDGLSNLVLSCATCNGAKSDHLPAPDHVMPALDRGRDLLDPPAPTTGPVGTSRCSRSPTDCMPPSHRRPRSGGSAT
ncbi:HNH endonuclease domain-containing protein [Gordonia sp. NPDC003376]